MAQTVKIIAQQHSPVTVWHPATKLDCIYTDSTTAIVVPPSQYASTAVYVKTPTVVIIPWMKRRA